MTEDNYGKHILVNFVNNTRFDIDGTTLNTLKRAVYTVLRLEGFNVPVELSVCVVSGEEIRAFNKKYRKIDKETDVLSFPSYAFSPPDYDITDISPPVCLGDIIISIEKAEEQAKEYGHSVLRELAFLTVHSTLHLLGYDHNNDFSESVMISKQKRVLDIEMGVIT